MSFSPRPCLHCASTSFHVIPGVQLEPHFSPTVFGLAESIKLRTANQRWSFTLVACAQCGRLEHFMTEAAKVSAGIPGAQTITTTRTA